MERHNPGPQREPQEKKIGGKRLKIMITKKALFMPLDFKDLGSNSSNAAPSPTAHIVPSVPPRATPGMVQVGPGAEHREGRSIRVEVLIL